jgi:hypothetical protein
MIHDDPSVTMLSQSLTISSLSPTSPEPQTHTNDDLDDVWGSDSDSNHDEQHYTHEGNSRGYTEVSDIPRLKEKHETEGYRDGVTKGKSESVQKGFDEGYALGAVFGLQMGRILGILEGVYEAIKTSASSGSSEQWEAEKRRLEGLFTDAKDELSIKRVLGAEYWTDEGIWKYKVEGEEEGKEVVFPDVVRAHPLIGKWQGIMDGELQRWGLDLGIMDRVREEDEIAVGKSREDVLPEKSAPGAAKELSW